MKKPPVGAAAFDRLWDWSLGFFGVWVVHLGRRFGLFQELARRRRHLSSGRLASSLQLDAHAVSLWCRAAHAIGLLRRRDGGYLLPPALRPLLADPGDPCYFAGQHSYLAVRSLDYGDFDAFFRKGSVTGSKARHLVEAFNYATEWDHTAFLQVFLPRAPEIARKLERGAAVLDLGCGTGTWISRVASVFPQSTFVGLEPDAPTLRAARSQARRDGTLIRTLWQRGRGEDLRDESRFDIIYLGEVLYAVKDRRRILRNCYRALKPGGHLVIAEGLVERRRSPRDRVSQFLSCMGLEFALQGSAFFRKEELRSLLERGGFRGLRFVPAGGGFWFVSALKPIA